MGTSLTGLTPATTYDALIKVGDNGPLSATAKYLSDGLGNDSALALSTGNIGIGTTSPSRNLHILGGSGVGTVLKLEAGSGAIAYLQLAYNGATNAQSGYIGYDSSSNMGLFTNDTERMRITSAGNVGIGTNSPFDNLTVSSPSYRGLSLTTTTAGNRPTVSFINTSGNDSCYIQGNGRTFAIGNVNSDYGGHTQVASFTTNGLCFGTDTAAANALDDYEEGTWTMGVSFGGGNTGITYASNTGSYTKIGRQVTVNGLIVLTSKGSSTGAANMTGLPFVIPNFTQNYSAASLWLFNIDFANQFQAIGIINSTTISLYEITESGTLTPLEDVDFANNSEIIVSMTYFV